MATAKKKTPAKKSTKKSNKAVFNDSQKNGLWFIFTILIILIAAVFIYCSMYSGI